MAIDCERGGGTSRGKCNFHVAQATGGAAATIAAAPADTGAAEDAAAATAVVGCGECECGSGFIGRGIAAAAVGRCVWATTVAMACGGTVGFACSPGACACAIVCGGGRGSSPSVSIFIRCASGCCCCCSS